MGIERERYTMYPMAANTTFVLRNYSIAGFLAKTGGTITVTDLNNVVRVDAIPITAGQYLPIPGMLQTSGGTVTLGGGASGTLFV